MLGADLSQRGFHGLDSTFDAIEKCGEGGGFLDDLRAMRDRAGPEHSEHRADGEIRDRRLVSAIEGAVAQEVFEVVHTAAQLFGDVEFAHIRTRLRLPTEVSPDMITDSRKGGCINWRFVAGLRIVRRAPAIPIEREGIVRPVRKVGLVLGGLRGRRDE